MKQTENADRFADNPDPLRTTEQKGDNRKEISSGFYYLQNGKPKFQPTTNTPNELQWDQLNVSDSGLPEETRVERVDTIDTVIDGRPVRLMIVGGIHADELQSPELFRPFLEDYPVSSTCAPNVHIIAGLLGQRSMIVPIADEEYATLPPHEQARVVVYSENGELQYIDLLHPSFDQKELIKLHPNLEINAKNGRRIDLNRCFGVVPEGDDLSLDDFIAVAPYPEAKLLIQYLKDHPETQVMFTLHEDPDFGHLDHVGRDETVSDDGFYFYCSSMYARGEDPEFSEIEILRARLIDKLRDEGFAIFAGIDDPHDPVLNLKVENGIIYQPMSYDNGGQAIFDSTYEGFANSCAARRVRISPDSEDIVQVRHSFTFEIPKYLSTDRKRRMIQIIKDDFMLPYLAYMT